jgi:hypothetical protein
VAKFSSISSRERPFLMSVRRSSARPFSPPVVLRVKGEERGEEWSGGERKGRERRKSNE